MHLGEQCHPHHGAESAEVTLAASASGEICYGEEVSFTATSGYTRYVFHDGNRVLLDSDQPQAIFPVSSSFVTVDAYNIRDCQRVGRDTIWFTILPLPRVNLTVSADTVCPQETVEVSAFPTTYPHYEFWKNDVRIASGPSPQTFASLALDSDSIYAMVTDAKGCVNRSLNAVSPFVKPFPDNRIASADTGVCLGDRILLTLELDPLIGTSSFHWNTGSTDTSLLVGPTVATSYWVTSVWDGCTVVSDSVLVEVDSDPPPRPGPASATRFVCMTASS
ncbi:MAG: hypothetical protein R2751_10470 [Bacteroidales bacterium]